MKPEKTVSGQGTRASSTRGLKPALRLVVLGFFIQFTTMSFGRFAYTLILPDMMRSLGFTIPFMGILGTCIVAGYLSFSLGSGALAGVIGPARTVRISIGGVSLALAALGACSSRILLAFACILLGAGAAGSYVPLIHMLNKHCARKGSIFGIVMGGAGLGMVLVGWALPLVLNLSAAAGYRYGWFTLAAVNSLVLAAALLFLEEDTGFRREARAGHGEPRLCLVKSLKQLPANPPLLLTVIVYFLAGFSYIIYITWFGAYAVNEAGFSTGTTGAMLSVFGVNSIYSGIAWGFVSDRMKKTLAAVLVTGLLAVSIFLPVPFTSRLSFYASIFLFGFAFMGFIVVTASLISDFAGREKMAAVFGASTLLHGAGQVVGVLLGGILKDTTGTFKIPFTLSFAVLAVGVLLFCRLHSGINSSAHQADQNT